MPATGVPALPQVVAKRFGHSRARLHPAAFRKRVEAYPFINALSVDAQVFRDLAHLQASGLHPPDGLKQLQLLLPPLPRRLRLVLPDAGAEGDLPAWVLRSLRSWRGWERGGARRKHTQM